MGDRHWVQRRFGEAESVEYIDLPTASNPSGWAGVLKVKTPSGAVLGYVLLFTNL